MKKAKDKRNIVFNNVNVTIKEIDLFTISTNYYKFVNQFGKSRVDELPSHSLYNHNVPLYEGIMPHWGPIYNLSLELETLSKYMEKNL
jgi:hypothetical protein